MEETTIKFDGKEYKVKIEEVGNGKIKVHFDGKSYEVETKAEIEKEILEVSHKKAEHGGASTVIAPLPGTVIVINVKVGSKVRKGDSLLKLVAMKMENDVVAEKDGIVKEIRVKKNESVNKNDILMIIN